MKIVFGFACGWYMHRLLVWLETEAERSLAQKVDLPRWGTRVEPVSQDRWLTGDTSARSTR